jgi:hypothetical protein
LDTFGIIFKILHVTQFVRMAPEKVIWAYVVSESKVVISQVVGPVKSSVLEKKVNMKMKLE